MTTRFTHVFFDFTNTLVRVRGSVGQIYADVARRHGLDAPADAIDASFAAAIDGIPQPVQPGLTTQAMAAREHQWWRQVAQRTLRPFGDFPRFEAFFDEVFELFRRAEVWELLPGVRRTLSALRAQGRTLGVISDMDARLYDAFDVLELREFFAFVCLSFRTGYAKPNRKLYESASARAGVATSSCVHVGDSITKDVEPALAAGMLAIHLNESQSGAAPVGAQVIQRLDALPPLLQRLESCAPRTALPESDEPR